MNPESKRADKHAKQYYESVRKMKTDVSRIAKKEVIELLHIGQQKAYKILKKMCQDGTLQLEGSGRNAYYSLTR